MSKHRIVASLAALALAVTGVFVTAPSAGASPAPSWSWWQPAPYTYYLSLGDSLGFGYSEANLATFEADVTDPDGVTDTSVDAAVASAFQGYTQVVAASLGVTDVENFSCPGETTSTMLEGPCPANTYPGWPYGTTAQIDAATDYLAQHQGERGVISLSIGADDVLGTIEPGSTCLTNPTCPELQSAMQTANNNLKTILRDLRNAAPKATIVVLTPYNPFGKAYPVSNIAAVTFNMMIGWTALLNGARVADAFWPINVQHATTFDCGSLVYYCTDPANLDVHPTDPGYGVIAGAIMKSIGYVEAPRAVCCTESHRPPRDSAGARQRHRSAATPTRSCPAACW
jgi:lysophospholipase L1-like esterase